MNVIAEIRLIQINGRNSSVELEIRNKKSQLVDIIKSYDPTAIEKTVDLLRMIYSNEVGMKPAVVHTSVVKGVAVDV